MAKELHRSQDRMIGGVVGGLSDYVDIDHKMGRILYIGITIITGFWLGIIMYIACLFIMKDEQ